MPAAAAVVLVWLGAEKPEARTQAALDRWAEGHGIRFQAPAQASPDNGDRRASELVEASEQGLDQARDQLTAGDDNAARQTLARLEQTLREHPELVQAGWLMAERCRLEGQIERGAQTGAAAGWERRADVLEGPRALAFGDHDEARPALARIDVTIAVRGARRYDVYWDGVRSAGQLATAAGEHHLVVMRQKEVGWAGWVSVLTSATVDVWVRDAAPCSAEDFAGMASRTRAAGSLGAERDLVVPSGIRCPSWGVSAPGEAPGTLRVALCERDRCGPIVTDVYEHDSIAKVAPSGPPARGFPPWAAWTLAGLGAVLATSVVLWRAGVFDRTEPSTKIVYDGSKL